ncbi:hypothetical protein PROFUN_12740 [Planoprotostelium fungivorum]|uniref:Uncharacterized protein n=1 Tax=Planoprotostelium fungivorum TaxID=1890364 RepID=A0A2P6N8J5_9EUKA|nr:hypothetical protein PROFUN_12740 [Planoprotostelium fungivorum]
MDFLERINHVSQQLDATALILRDRRAFETMCDVLVDTILSSNNINVDSALQWTNASLQEITTSPQPIEGTARPTLLLKLGQRLTQTIKRDEDMQEGRRFWDLSLCLLGVNRFNDRESEMDAHKLISRLFVQSIESAGLQLYSIVSDAIMKCFEEMSKEVTQPTFSLDGIVQLSEHIINGAPSSPSKEEMEDKLYPHVLTLLRKSEHTKSAMRLVAALVNMDSHPDEILKERLRSLWQVITEMNGILDSNRESFGLCCQFFHHFFNLRNGNVPSIPPVDNRNKGKKKKAETIKLVTDVPLFDLRMEEVYWKMIITGLSVSSDEAITRKRAAFLLKKTIDYTYSHDKRGNMTRYFHWSQEHSEHLSKLWSTFFLIYDTFDDIKLHLVKPIWSQLEYVQSNSVDRSTTVQDSDDKLDMSWVDILYLRALKAESPTIKKWIFITLLQNDSKFRYRSEFLLGTALESLSTPLIYKGLVGAKMSDYVTDFFLDHVNHLSSSQKIDFVEAIVYHLKDNTVCRSLVIAILSFMSKMEQTPVLKGESMKAFSQLVQNKVYIMYHTYRTKSYGYVLTILRNLTDTQRVDFDDMTSLLRYLPVSECEEKHGRTTFSQWLDRFEENQGQEWLISNIQTMIKNYVEPTLEATGPTSYDLSQSVSQSKVIVRLHRYIRDEKTRRELLEPIVDIASRLYSNAYMQKTLPERVLALITSAINEGADVESWREIVRPLCPEFSSYVQSAIQAVQSVRKFDENHAGIYMSVLQSCLSIYNGVEPSLQKLVEYLSEKLPQWSQNLTLNSPDFSTELWKMSWMIMLSTISHSFTSTDQLISLIPTVMNLQLAKISTAREDAREVAWHILIKRFSIVKWECVTSLVTSLLKNDTVSKECDVGGWLDVCMEEISNGTGEYLIPLFETTCLFLGAYVSVTSDVDRCLDAISRLTVVGWNAVREKTFRELSLICSLISCIMQPAILNDPRLHPDNPDAPVKLFMNQVMEEAETTFSIANSLSFYCRNSWMNVEHLNIAKKYIPELYKMVCFSPNRKLMRQSKKEEDMVLEYEVVVFHYTSYVKKNVPHSDHYVRVAMMTLFIDLVKRESAKFHQNPQDQEAKEISDYVSRVMCDMMEWEYSGEAFRAWSPLHRSKICLWQFLSLLCLHIKHMTSTAADEWNNKAWHSLLGYNHKSVRQYMDYSMIYFEQYHTRRTHLERLMRQINERSDILHSALTISAYLICSKNRVDEDSLYLMKMISIHCLSNHATIRKMAQYAFVYRHWTDHKLAASDELMEQYKELHFYITTNEECLKQLEDPRTVFLSDVQDVPSRSTTSGECFFDVDLLLYKFSKEDAYPLQDAISPDLFEELVQDETLSSNYEREEEKHKLIEPDAADPEFNHHSEEFQKKITPWSELEYEDNMFREEIVKNKDRQQLIIVATFVDKIPNLAGLSRTSEIFNVHSLVVPSRKVESDKLFQEISVTSEKWVPIEEVTEEDLARYLREKREEGWSLIGVEQTSNSVDLTRFEFPKKCLLLLGKEKEGIPVEFIQMLDQCVEIPQLGLVRSLNVHSQHKGYPASSDLQDDINVEEDVGIEKDAWVLIRAGVGFGFRIWAGSLQQIHKQAQKVWAESRGRYEAKRQKRAKQTQQSTTENHNMTPSAHTLVVQMAAFIGIVTLTTGLLVLLRYFFSQPTTQSDIAVASTELACSQTLSSQILGYNCQILSHISQIHSYGSLAHCHISLIHCYSSLMHCRSSRILIHSSSSQIHSRSSQIHSSSCQILKSSSQILCLNSQIHSYNCRILRHISQILSHISQTLIHSRTSQIHIHRNQILSSSSQTHSQLLRQNSQSSIDLSCLWNSIPNGLNNPITPKLYINSISRSGTARLSENKCTPLPKLLPVLRLITKDETQVPKTIVTVGYTQSGKSSMCNFLCNNLEGRDSFKVGNGFESCTTEVKSREIEWNQTVIKGDNNEIREAMKGYHDFHSKKKQMKDFEHLTKEEMLDVVREREGLSLVETKHKMKIIDTAGAGDSEDRDAEHMLDLYKMLVDCKSISCIVLVFKYPTLLDDKCKKNLQFYRSVFSQMFHQNVVMVITGYQLDRRWQRNNTANGITPEGVVKHLELQMEKILGIRVPTYTIDSRATPEDEEDYKAAMRLRRTLFERCCNIPGSNVETARFPKPNKWMAIDQAKIKNLQAKRTGISSGLQMACSDIADISKQADELAAKKEDLDARKMRNTAELSDIDNDREIITKEVRYKENDGWFYDQVDFDERPVYPITKKEWSGGLVEYDVETPTQLKGRVSSNWFSSLDCTVTLYTKSNIKHQRRIKDIREDQEHLSAETANVLSQFDKTTSGNKESEEKLSLLRRQYKDLSAEMEKLKVNRLSIREIQERLSSTQ